jgi:DNA repair protein RadC
MTDVIRDMPLDDRPREKLMEQGPSQMSNADLLAILLGSGTRGMNAIQLARHLLRDGVDGLAQRDVADLARTRGVGMAKATRLAAAFEISRRRRRMPREKFELKDFGEMLVETIAHYRQERLGVALLDARHHIMRRKQIFVGTVNHTVVSTREIIQYALQHDAVAVVIYHNHPSGNTEASGEDVSFTKKLRDALKLVDIELVDHLIIAGRRYASLKSRGYLDK